MNCWTEHVHDSCYFVQQGPDGEGGAEYSQDVGVPASSAQHPLSGGGLLHSIQMRMKRCNMCTGMLLLCHLSPCTCCSNSTVLPSLLPAAEPVPVGCSRAGGGVVRPEEAVGGGGADSHREWIQTGCGAQTLVPSGTAEQDARYDMGPYSQLHHQ